MRVCVSLSPLYTVDELVILRPMEDPLELDDSLFTRVREAHGKGH